MNQVSFYGGETAGSIGKLQLGSTNRNICRVQSPKCDTLNFKGNSEEDSSLGKTLAKAATGGILAFGALAYAHKAGYINKIGNAGIKKYLNIVAEPCHSGCSKIKNFAQNCYNKIIK